jgi:nucleoside-diphosphate-sugar epimerase
MSKDAITNILVTGNQGYIGSVLTPSLIAKGFKVIGYDTEYYGADCLLYQPGGKPDRQHKKDIRDITVNDLENIDAIIHLAALSNDPLGELMPGITEEVNLNATLRLAEYAKRARVKRFIFASSQSMYGIANTDAELDEDASEKNPVTSYAKTKWLSECELKKLNGKGFAPVFLRPATVFGKSSKLRCDIIFNSLVACAYTTKMIEIKSDGTPWRPVIHVNDLCEAFLACLIAPLELIENEAFNVGMPDGNYTVRQIAETAQRVVSGAELVFTGEHGSDSRTYRVSFKKILTRLKKYYRPQWNLISGGEQLVELFRCINFSERDFRNEKCNRLPMLKKLIKQNQLNEELRWVE